MLADAGGCWLKLYSCMAVPEQLREAGRLQILFLLTAGSQQPFTARPGPKIRLGADRMKFGSFLQGA